MTLTRQRLLPLLLILFPPLPVLAVQPEPCRLRWKFTEDDVFRLRITQNVQTATLIGDRRTTANVTTALEIHWSVDRVVQDGSAWIRQSLQRIFLKGVRPDESEMVYDSDSPDRTSPALEDMARRLKPLLDSPFLILVSPRGQIQEVRAPPETESRLSDPESAKLANRLGSIEFVKTLLRPSLGLLPVEAVQVGNTWSSTRETVTLQGKMEINETYRYAGPVNTQNRRFVQFRSSLQAKPVPENSDNPVASFQNQTGASPQGQFLFDREQGMLVSSLLSSTQSFETPYGGSKLRVQTTTATRLRIDRPKQAEQDTR